MGVGRAVVLVVVFAFACRDAKPTSARQGPEAAVAQAARDAPSPAPDAGRGVAGRHVPQVQLAGADALLDNLAARMFTAPGALWPRVAKASAIVLGTVKTADVSSHVPLKATLGDPEVKKSTLQGDLMTNVVKIAVERWYVGAGGKLVVVIYPAPNEVSTADPAEPQVGQRGILLLEKLPATPLGRELGRGAPGAYGIAIVEPAIVPVEPSLEHALLLIRGPTLPGVAAALRAKGRALEVVLGVATRARSKPITDLVRARVDKPETAETLLVRAALWKLGERDAALAAIDLRDEAIAPLEAFVGEDGKITAASPETPLP